MVKIDTVEGTSKYPVIYRLRVGDSTLFTSISEHKVTNLYELFTHNAVYDSLSFKMLPHKLKLEALMLGFDGVFPSLTKERLNNVTPFEECYLNNKPYWRELQLLRDYTLTKEKQENVINLLEKAYAKTKLSYPVMASVEFREFVKKVKSRS